MNDATPITDEAIRAHLIARARAYADRTKCSFSFISEEAVKDSKFLANAERGANFTIKTYQRVIDWLDAAEAKLPEDEPTGAAA